MKRLARLGPDLDHVPVRQHRDAAGHCGTVAAMLSGHLADPDVGDIAATSEPRCQEADGRWD
jgi:hypothetical protein